MSRQYLEKGPLGGNNSFGKITKVEDSETKIEYARKEIPRAEKGISLSGMTVREVSFMRMIKSPHILYAEDVIIDDGTLGMITELMEGSLTDLLSSPIDIDPIMAFAEIVSGISLLHANKIIHSDLKPDNILFRGGKYKIGDLDSILGLYPRRRAEVTTILYRAPEVLAPMSELIAVIDPPLSRVMKISTFTEAIDIWALGLIFFALITRRSLVASDNAAELSTQIIRRIWNHPYMSPETFERYFDKIPMKYHSLLFGMLEMDPQKRFTITRVIEEMVTLGHPISTEGIYDDVPVFLPPIIPEWRTAVLEWLNEICAAYKFNISIFLLATDIHDRYMNGILPTRGTYQGIGAACLLLSSKLFKRDIDDRILAKAGAGSFTYEQLLEFEKDILIKLKFNIYRYSPLLKRRNEIEILAVAMKEPYNG